MSLFAISDLHLSLGVDKPMTIFSGWENYVEKLKKNWEETVSNEDTVVIAGDISWGMHLDECLEDFRFLNELPGKKVLIKGNHDFWWTSVTKNRKFFANHKFDNLSMLHNSAVKYRNFYLCGTKGYPTSTYPPNINEKILNREIGRFARSIESASSIGAELIAFFHYPPVSKGSGINQFVDMMVEKNIKKCYYGHVHRAGFSNKVLTGFYRGIEFSLISCDFVNFTPVLVAV